MPKGLQKSTVCISQLKNLFLCKVRIFKIIQWKQEKIPVQQSIALSQIHLSMCFLILPLHFPSFYHNSMAKKSSVIIFNSKYQKIHFLKSVFFSIQKLFGKKKLFTLIESLANSEFNFLWNLEVPTLRFWKLITVSYIYYFNPSIDI